MRRQANEEFEVGGTTHVFSTFHIEEDDPLQLGDRGHDVRGGCFILNSQIDDERAAPPFKVFPRASSTLCE